MHPALWASVTGLDARNADLRVISNNLANASTAGFKSDRTVFEDLLYQKVRQAGGSSSESTDLPSGLMLGTGVRLTATQKDFSQGTLVRTDNSLDLAVSGQGFFQVLHPDGQNVYVRDGRFQMSANGTLVTANGYTIQPNLIVPPQTVSITIGKDGTVSALTDGNVTPVQIGNLTLANFVNPAGLDPMGENQWRETAASGPPQVGTPGSNALGTIEQGFYESSNVNVVAQLVLLIETQRGYEVTAKSIEAVDGMLRYAVQSL